jgi:DNA invertase Pin-like site-specific DNA recombinase
VEKVKTTAVYLRVSTDDQNLDSQRDSLAAVCRQRGWTEVTVYEDKASGADTSRRALAQLMADVRLGRVGQIVVFRLDRLGRSLPHLAQIIGELDTNGVGLLVPDQGIDTTTSNPAARLQLHVLMAVAEFERAIIRERVKAGIAAAKARGKHLGRPKGSGGISKAKLDRVKCEMTTNPNITIRELAFRVGISTGSALKLRREFVGGEKR